MDVLEPESIWLCFVLWDCRSTTKLLKYFNRGRIIHVHVSTVSLYMYLMNKHHKPTISV